MAFFVASTNNSSRISARLLIVVPVLLLALGVSADAQTAHFSEALVTLPIGTVINPYGMAVDTNGNVYVADNAENSLSELTPSESLTSGGTFLSGDGSPYGIAVDGNGNLYITDNLKNEVVKETPNPGGYYTRSVLPFSGLSNPHGVAVDAQGNVYVADYLNDRVVKATPSGGTYTQSTVPTSSLSLPEAVAVDGSGNLYISDTFNARVLKETPSGTSYTESVVVNLKNFGEERAIDIAADGAGDVFILEYLDDQTFTVLKETLSGGVYTQSSVSSYGQNPYGIAADAAGDVYIVSPGNNRLLKEGPETNFGAFNVGSTSIALSLVFTFDTQSTLSSPAVLTQGDTGLDFLDAGTGTCGKQKSTFVYSPGATCSVSVIFKPQVSGSRSGAAVLQDASGNTLATAYVSGTGVAPQISYPSGPSLPIGTLLVNPSGVAVDALGNVFFAESGTGNVYKETVSLLAFARYSYSRKIIASGLNHPTAVALDGAGNVYVATSSMVYKEKLSDGGYVQSQIVTDLTNLVGIAVDRSGNLYLTSSVSGNVHKETLQTNGSYTETAVGFGIVSPTGVAVDGGGDIFILDAKDGNLYKETLQANGSYAQTTVALAISEPENLTVDGNGSVYVADASRGQIDKLTLETNGSYTETIARSGLNEPSGLAVDGQGNLYYSEGAAGDLNMIDVADAPVITFAITKPQTTSTDSPRYVTVANIGNAPLSFPALASGTNAYIIGVPAFALDGESTCPVVGAAGVAASLDAGSSCVYGVSFMPEYRGTYLGYVVLSDNNLNAVESGPGSGQDVQLNGPTATSDATRTTMRVNPNSVAVGLGVTITVTVTDTSTSATVVQGGVSFTDSVGGQVLSLNGGAAVPLSGGKVVLTIVPSVAGAHTITAHYGGVDDSFLGSTAEASLTVQP
ncbi:MAG: Ig-like domain repeat protein [Acidobacteriaceae bacterium]